MSVGSRIAAVLRSVFFQQSARRLERDRAECLYLAALADQSAGDGAGRGLTQLITTARPAQLRALATVLRERAARRVNGLDLPEAGRSSTEGTLADRFGGTLSFYEGVSPVIDFELLSVLKHLWVYNPDVSQYVANIVNLANPGHSVVVQASSARRAEAAVRRLNESAARLYKNGAGIDGLINSYLQQIAWSGALSSEDVVDFARRRVEKVVLVPVEQIRFRYLEGEYVPHQQTGAGAGLNRSPLGLIPLNEETYRYYALQTVENSPYAKPPATAAVAAITGPQKDMVDNIKFIAKKLGLFGLVSVAVAKPDRRGGETEEQHQARARKYLAQVGAAVEKITNKGLIVTYDDQKVSHTNVVSDARGVYEVFRMNEEQVISGLNSIPAFFGRTDSSTETYADVVYNFMVAQAGNVQRLAKRRQERTYMLDLRLAGIEVDAVSLSFNRMPARNPLNQAQADRVRAETAILKAEAGIISPHDAAQELGYDSAFDPDILLDNKEASKKLQTLAKPGGNGVSPLMKVRFDSNANSYRFVPEKLSIAGVEKNVHS